MPPTGTALCAIDALDDPGAKGFLFGEGKARFDMFVVRQGDQVHAYVNECPHAFTPLDTWPDRFLTFDETRIICSTHAALFRIEDGYCTSGPCAGKSLIAIDTEIVDGIVRIA
jgi:nitrite reductase/ring-hydroxylating ferredoxin subunit